ncbi:hypothetical protein [Nocardia asiatica]|uniref:hypothetical protein n=1 Tax=Nocardia asiatica TaxID=209252 RepID=UPI003EE008D5
MAREGWLAVLPESRELRVALTAGATSDTPVTAVPVENNDEMLDSLRIEFGQSGPAQVERREVNELLGLLAEIEQNDGDARAQLRSRYYVVSPAQSDSEQSTRQ